MRTTALQSTDGFVVLDLDDAPRSSGIVRVARKILHDGAVNLARERTYAGAAFGLKVGGASAGLNAEPPDAAAAVTAMLAELAGPDGEPTLTLRAAKGVPPGAMAGAGPDDDTAEHAMAALSAVVAAIAALGPLDGVSVGIDADCPGAEAVAAEFGRRGAAVTTAGLDDLSGGAHRILCVGGRPAAFDHQRAEAIDTELVVPVGALAVTAKGLAVAARRGAVVLPGFVTTAGAFLAREEFGEGVAPHDDRVADHVAEHVGAVIASALADDDGPFLGACRDAERFLASWTDERPFGRPLA